MIYFGASTCCVVIKRSISSETAANLRDKPYWLLGCRSPDGPVSKARGGTKTRETILQSKSTPGLIYRFLTEQGCLETGITQEALKQARNNKRLKCGWIEPHGHTSASPRTRAGRGHTWNLYNRGQFTMEKLKINRKHHISLSATFERSVTFKKAEMLLQPLQMALMPLQTKLVGTVVYQVPGSCAILFVTVAHHYSCFKSHESPVFRSAMNCLLFEWVG